MSEKLSMSDYARSLPRDLSSGIVVFLVALPLCLGIAVASNAPALSGLVAGAVGGLLVAWLSGSHTSVSGPAAGLTAIMIAQIETLGSFQALLVAVVMAGVLQILLGAMRAGSLAAFFPSSVIKGLLAAIGIILILKQYPHLLGHDPDWMGDLGFVQRDGENTFTEIAATTFDIHFGALVVGLSSLILLIVWDKTPLKKIPLPAPLFVVVFGVGLAEVFRMTSSQESVESGQFLVIGISHLVQVPVSESLQGLWDSLYKPDWSVVSASPVYIAAVTIAIVASLETLLNLEAVDNLDRKRRVSPPNRELVAQGFGNMASGMLGGLPMTSVIVRSSVNVTAGSETRVSAFVHGILLFMLVAYFPGILNKIPLASLAAILMVTGFKLASPKVIKQMWREGVNQFLPFAVTIVAIIMTDLLVGIAIGIVVSFAFILRSNLSQPVRRIMEKHVGGDVLRIVLPTQVSFLNRASLISAFAEIPRGGHVVLDAQKTTYIDPDIRDLLTEFEKVTGPAKDLTVSLSGFKDQYSLKNRVQYVDVSTRDVQSGVTPAKVIELLKAGNERFVKGEQVARDPRRQVGATSEGQFPLAVVLACMDSRIATEMLFDLGLGDIFSVRVAGNNADEKQMGSIEYGCAVAGAKALVVMGHTRCGAVNASIDFAAQGTTALEATGCQHIDSITEPIGQVIATETSFTENRTSKNDAFSLRITEMNVLHTIREIQEKSSAIKALVDKGDLVVVGAVYDVRTGEVHFLDSKDQPATSQVQTQPQDPVLESA